MHIEFLVEDSSGEKLLEIILPKIIGSNGDKNSWRLHSYKGIGKIPKGLNAKIDPSKRVLLNQLPGLLRGFGKSSGIDAVVVVADSDGRDCKSFLSELQAIVLNCNPAPKTMFRLAIEEVEAWYFGDRQALLQAYPKAKRPILDEYKQDSVCGTWEKLADAVYSGGIKQVKKQGWPAHGNLKHQWAEKIAPLLDPDRNVSPSFQKLRDGLRQLVADAESIA